MPPSPEPPTQTPLAGGWADSSQSKLNLIHHHSLHVLGFLRRNNKFASTPIPPLTPSPFSASPAFAFQATASSPTDANNDASPTAPRHAPPSSERDSYLDHCQKLFLYAGHNTTAQRPNSAKNNATLAKSGSKLADSLDPAVSSAPVAIHLERAASDHHISKPSTAGKKTPPALSPLNDTTNHSSLTDRTPLINESTPTSSPPNSPTHPTVSVQHHHIALPASVLIQGFEELLKRLATLPSPKDLSEHVSPLFLVTPFVRVVQSGDATGPITTAVMHALSSFIDHNVIDQEGDGNFADLQLAVTSMVATVYQAKFESADPSSDDSVLYRILGLAQSLIKSAHLAPLLTDEAVCQLFELGLSMWMMADASDLVHQHALNLLETMIHFVFSHPNLNLQLAIPKQSNELVVTESTTVPHDTGAAATEILRVLASILLGDPTPSSESSLVLAHHLIQHLVTVSASAELNETIVSTYLPPCLTLLGSSPQPVNAASQQVRPIFGIGLTAPLGYHAISSPTINVMVMTWHTIQIVWTKLWPMLAPFYELLMGHLLLLEGGSQSSSSRSRASSNFKSGGAAKPAAAGSNTSASGSSVSVKAQGLESWEVRQARIMVLKQITSSADLLFALWAHWDCHPDRPDLLKRLVEYHCELLESSVQGMFVLGLDFLRGFLITLNSARSVVNQEMRTRKQRKAQIHTALELFRSNPKKSIEYMVKAGILPNKEPKTVAEFIFRAPGIDKAMVGEYISKPANSEILGAYMEQFVFKGLRVDQALRLMMQRFRLPGESQMIDRVLDTFAKHFFSHNPEQKDIANMDAGFILAFSLIMLNTDQHNPQVRNRMDLDSFCRNLRGLNNKHDFRREFLDDMFHAIQSNEITDEISMDNQLGLALSEVDPLLIEQVVQGLRSDFVDTEAILQNVFPIMVEGLLASTEPRVLPCLALLAQQPECTESLLAKLALKSMLSPIQSPSILNDVTAVGGSTQPGPSLRKPKLHHTHLILFFSTLYHQRTSLTTAAKEYATHALANLFMHDLLPDKLMTYQDPVRLRSTRIPILASPESAHDNEQDKGSQPKLGEAQAVTSRSHLEDVSGSRASTPNPMSRTSTPSASINAPRAGSSLFSFLSYISTTFTATPALNEEDLLVKDVLAKCHLDQVAISVSTFDSIMADIRAYPHLGAFLTVLLLVAIETNPRSIKSQINPSNTVPEFRNHLLALMNLAPQVGIAVTIRAAVHWPQLMADDLDFAQRIVAGIPNIPDVLSGLSIPPDYTAVQTVPVLAILPYLSRSQFIDTVRKCKAPELAVALLNAGPIRQLEEGDLKEVIMVVYRLLIRADSVDAVRSLANAALLPDVYTGIMAHGSSGIEYLKLFAIVALHPSVTQVRSLVYLERALFTMKPAIELSLVPGLVKEVLVPLLFQYRVLISESNNMRDKTIAVGVKNGCLADQAKATAMMVKYYISRVGDLSVAQIEPVWHDVVSTISTLVSTSPVNERLVESTVPVLENAIRIMHSVGTFTDPASGKPTKLWKLTLIKVGKLLPELEDSLFPTSDGSKNVFTSSRASSPSYSNRSPSPATPAAGPSPVKALPSTREPASVPADPFQLAQEENHCPEVGDRVYDGKLGPSKQGDLSPAHQEPDITSYEVMDI